jgi:tartrate-resistant acid phosphatase type 5
LFLESSFLLKSILCRFPYWLLVAILSIFLLTACSASVFGVQPEAAPLTPAPIETAVLVPVEPFHTPTEPVPAATETFTPSEVPEFTPTQTASPLPTNTPTPTSTQTPTLTPTPTPEPIVRFAVIGDYGLSGQPAAEVANLVKSWEPDFIITTGDNNYPDGAWETIDENIGQYYHEFIHPYRGIYGPGATENRFFPTLGNHDYYTDHAQPYFDYFELPGNQRYYDFTWGPVHLFALNSNYQDPDGVGSGSAQAAWLREQLAASGLPWKIVYMHHPPYSSGYHGPTDWIRWPFKEWGASAVLTGHDHNYERLMINDFPYFVNGLGGGARYYFREPHPNSASRFSADWGAQLVIAAPSSITFEFFTRSGELIDTFTLLAPSTQASLLLTITDSLP